MILTIYGDSISGNCLKVKWTADRLGLDYRWIETGVMAGETRTPEFLKLNPAGQVPAVILPDGRGLAQSNAIILHLADGSDLVPADRYLKSKMMEWLFWEQYSHEPYVAVLRFQVRYLGKALETLDPNLIARADGALRRLDAAVAETGWLVGDALSLADIALVAYTRVSHEGGVLRDGLDRLQAWIERVEAALGLDASGEVPEARSGRPS